ANAIDKDAAVNPDELFVKSAFVDEGFRMKRVRPAPMGRAYRVQKRTCHITLQLGREE
ncbi:MAG: 50S ribosomal protein L22, partial [Holophaga sp.]|nr:50S ribosomal protein L22 [Holophaga sp.]